MATAAADTPNFFSKSFTSSFKSITLIDSIESTIALNFAGTSTTSFGVVASSDIMNAYIDWVMTTLRISSD